MIAAGNAVVFNPHPGAKLTSNTAVDLVNRAILEAERAIFILDKFNENELFGNELSVFSESMALAYAMNSDYENCMLQLEKAVDYADKYDNSGCSGSDERASSVKSLLSLLGSDARKEYSPIRNTKRFAAILNK